MNELQQLLDKNNLIIEQEKQKNEETMGKIEEFNKQNQEYMAELEELDNDDDYKLIRFDNINELTPENMFELKMENLYIKRQLYNFAKVCDELDSVHEWRLKLVKLIYSYMCGFLFSPNKNPFTGKNEPLQNKPGYEYFNIILKGNPGIGKSFTSEKIGLALMYSGLLTKGKLIPLKKPDLIGQYTGQTAPKVYNELSRAMGNVVFLDEAYSIAGKMDETKGSYNEFGQEALDAITDFTSEHIGLFGIVAAGYSYEMQKQFLDVNIGLPRRFPTVLTLNRYNMNSYWKIIKSSLINISPKNQVNNYHRACFEILNLMFSNSPPPNPILKLSDNFNLLFNSLILQNIVLKAIYVKLKLQNNGDKYTTFMSLKKDNLDGSTAGDVTFTPFEELISDKKETNKEFKQTTIAYLKSYFIYLYTGLINGDPFRSQADNVTKFTETILADKIFNGGKLFDQKLEQDKVTNFAWIEYIYFSLYFKKNPNNVSVNNIDYEFNGRDPNLTEEIKIIMKEFLEKSETNKYIQKEIINKSYQLKNMEERKRSKESEIIKREPRAASNTNIKQYLQGGGDVELNFYINIENIGDKKDLSSRVINMHIKMYKFDSGEDNKENIKNETDELTNLLDNFNKSDDTNDNTIYMYVILSAYVTACEEYIKPEGPFKTDGWWFYDKEHFKQIVKVLKIKDILKKYNSAEVSSTPNTSSQAGVENIIPPPLSIDEADEKNDYKKNEKDAIYEGGKNKTLRVLYKTKSGKHTRYSRR